MFVKFKLWFTCPPSHKATKADSPSYNVFTNLYQRSWPHAIKVNPATKTCSSLWFMNPQTPKILWCHLVLDFIWRTLICFLAFRSSQWNLVGSSKSYFHKHWPSLCHLMLATIWRRFLCFLASSSFRWYPCEMWTLNQVWPWLNMVKTWLSMLFVQTLTIITMIDHDLTMVWLW